MRQSRKRIASVTLDGIMLACCYGDYVGVEQASNLLLFLVWLQVVLAVTACNRRSWARLHAQGRSMPAWYAVTVDIAVIAYIAAAGWFASAIALAVSALIVSGIFSAPPPERES